MKKSRIALPVMMHSEEEIEAFKEAKARMESIFPVNVGTFTYLLPFALSEERKEAGIKNQEKHKLEIFHMQTPIAYENSLIHGQADSELFGKKNVVEDSLKYAGELIKHSPRNFPIHADTHTGVYVFQGVQEDHPFPGVFSVDYFTKNKDDILNKAQRRFRKLSRIAKESGMEGLLLENEPIVNFEPGPDSNKTPTLMYRPFGTPLAMSTISKYQTFDSNHFAATANVPRALSDNGISTDFLFNLLGIKSTKEYHEKFSNINSYLRENTKAVHLSNTEGIGVHLSDPEDLRKWGADGTVDGTLSQGELKYISEFSRKRDLPIAIEVNYDVKNIPTNKFNEADPLLKVAL